MRCIAKFLSLILFAVLFLTSSCNRKRHTVLPPQEILADIHAVPQAVSNQINSILDGLNDSPDLIKGVKFCCIPLMQKLYTKRDDKPYWIENISVLPRADTFLNYLQNSAYDGLYRNDYHFDSLIIWRKNLMDSLKQHDALLWTKFDLALTDGFLHVVQDLKQGRMQPDSLSMSYLIGDNFQFFNQQFNQFIGGESLDSIFKRLQPIFPGYDSLHMLVKEFVQNMDTSNYTYIKYPFKNGDKPDSLKFVLNLFKRLSEEGLPAEMGLDSASLEKAIKAYQKKEKIKETGKIDASLIGMLNLTDKMKFTRIAITLDRYKSMPSPIPEQFILINIPSFSLQLYNADTIALASRIICGKPTTPTPFISSAIFEMITMPTWTVPASIIQKEIIPGMKKNPGYLSRKGLSLYNKKDEWVDPSTVNWEKYTKGIPFKVMQGSGEDNALGVIKFNFFNPFDVYLHDTNQRYLFKKTVRALSHGCIRVEEWKKLAAFIAANDSLKLPETDTLRYNIDSINNWIQNKERHKIRIKNRVSLFIRYFTCEAKNGKIHFYNDIYNDDKRLNEKYFRNQQVSFN